MSSCARACTSVWCEPTRALRVANPQGIYAICWCSRTGLRTMCFCARERACADELMCESLYICTVRAHKGFVLLYFFLVGGRVCR